MPTDRTVAICTASSNSGFQCLQDLLAYRGDTTPLKIKAVFRTETRSDECMGKLETIADPSWGELGAWKRKVEVVVGVDAMRKETLQSAFAGAEIAVIVTPNDPAVHTFAHDSEMCLNMVEAAVASGTVKHIIYVGSWTVHAPDQVKFLADRFVPTEERLGRLDAGISFTSLRSGFFFPNFGRMLGSMAKAGTIVWPNVKIPAVDPRDMGTVAAAICTSPTYAASHGGKYYDISGPENLSIKEVVAEINAGLGAEAGHTIAFQEITLQAFAASLSFVPLREIFETMVDKPDLIPFSKDTELVTGKPARSLRAWVEQNRAAFLPDP